MDAVKQSPLLDAHLALGARMVPFAGWNMPVQYAGIREEHAAVRTGAGVFDISHMGQFVVEGASATAWLDTMLTNDVTKLAVGRGQYTLMLNEGGGVIDDLIVYREGEEAFFAVVNASRIDEDFGWLNGHLAAGVTLRDESVAWAGMAVQGPQAGEVWGRMFPAGPELPTRNGILRFPMRGGDLVVCRTGYTGEDGFEFFCAASDAVSWWDKIVAAGATPCGLGARDTLRLEMGYPLNGSDLTPQRTPIEAGLRFFVKLDKGEFVGRRVLAQQAADGPAVRLLAFRMTGKGPPPRAHYPVVHDGQRVGEITSGTLSPSLDQGIGMAYLPAGLAEPGTEIGIDIRGRVFPAVVVKKPFYKPQA